MLYTTFVTEPDWLEFGMKCLPSLLLYILKCLLIRKSAKTIVDNAQDCQSFKMNNLTMNICCVCNKENSEQIEREHIYCGYSKEIAVYPDSICTGCKIIELIKK